MRTRSTLFLVTALAWLAGCPAGSSNDDPSGGGDGPMTPLGPAPELTQAEYDALAEDGEFFDPGPMDPDAEAEKRAETVADARKVVEEHLAEFPEDADLFDPELVIGDGELLPDGNLRVDLLGDGNPIVLQGKDLITRESAKALETYLEPDNQMKLVDLLVPLLPGPCESLTPSQRLLASATPEQLKVINDRMAECISDFHAFATPFDHDPTDDPQSGPQDQITPVDTGTCDNGPYTILDGGGSDSRSSCDGGPSNGLIRNYAYYPWLPPVTWQGTRGTCVAFGTSSAIEYSIARREGKTINVSEQMVYSVGKWDFDGEHFGDGLNTADFLEELADRSTPLVYETSWGYNPSTCRQELGDDDNPFAYLDSCVHYDNDACSESAHQLGLYTDPNGNTVLYRPQSLGDGATVEIDKTIVLPGGIFVPGFIAVADAASSAGAGVVMSATVTNNWNNENMNGGFIADVDNTRRGGHAIHLVRVVYDSNAPGGAWLVFKNSWSCGWGDAGYGYMSLQEAVRNVRSMVIIEPSRDVFNEFPEVQITAPQDGFSEPFAFGFGGHELTLTANVTDDESDCCDVSWVSDVDGDLGTGNPITVGLSTSGVHTLTATVRDGWGVTASDSIVVNFTNQAPNVTIERPEFGSGPLGFLGERIPRGARIPLVGTASDPNNLFFPPPCDMRRWYVEGSFIGTGCERITIFPDTGFQQIRHTAEDPQGAVGEKSRFVRVVDWGPNDPPWARIINPPGNDFGMWVFETLDIDVELVGATLLEPTVQWTLRNRITGTTLDLGTQPQFTFDPDALNVDGPFDLEVVATDANGTAFDSVPLSVIVPPS